MWRREANNEGHCGRPHGRIDLPMRIPFVANAGEFAFRHRVPIEEKSILQDELDGDCQIPMELLQLLTKVLHILNVCCVSRVDARNVQCVIQLI